MGEAAARRESTETAGIRVPPPLFYVAGLLAGVGLELAFPIDGPPAWVRIAVAVLGVAGSLYLDVGAMGRFRRAGTAMIPFTPTTALVTDGPYRITRNPMYVGMASLYVAVAVAFGLIWALVLLPLVLLAVDRLVIAKEEPYLERLFGEPYLDYKRRVRPWL
ncbi:MAG: methyltransferase family protein [Solirubrobacterales bacterium]